MIILKITIFLFNIWPRRCYKIWNVSLFLGAFMYMLFTLHLGFYLKFHKRNTLLKQSQTYQPLRTKNTGRGERAGAWQGHSVATAPPRHPPPGVWWGSPLRGVSSQGTVYGRALKPTALASSKKTGSMGIKYMCKLENDSDRDDLTSNGFLIWIMWNTFYMLFKSKVSFTRVLINQWMYHLILCPILEKLGRPWCAARV